MKTIRRLLFIIISYSVLTTTGLGQEDPGKSILDNCEAFFVYSPNPSEPLTFEFTDQSTGFIDEWSWTFGDGAVSDEQNPIHAFSGSGIYQVCLTISNYDSLNFCYDVYCDTIVIQDSIECIAEFSYVLDSNSNTLNKFHFYDASSGDPDYWLWDFGDGHTSSEQNPVHTFQQEGQYNVCLTVAKSNIIYCVDTACKLIKMPGYFSFGGFAFAGDQPLNNPVPSGDTGVALLYRVYPNDQLILLDTNTFTDYGYYHFSNKLPGKYLVKVMLTPTSTNFKHYMTAYYPHHHYWKQAQNIFITDSNAYNMHVHLLEIPGAEQGPGTISGQVIQEQHPPFERPYPPMQTEIILADMQNVPLDFTFCDQNGRFSFSNIAYGQYKLFTDHTGKYALPVLVEIDEWGPFVDTLQITLSNHSLTTINEPAGGAPLIAGNIFPNPVGDILHLDIRTLNSIEVTLQLMNVHGNVLLEQHQTLPGGNNRLKLLPGDLPKGVYILIIRVGREYVTSRKFIK